MISFRSSNYSGARAGQPHGLGSPVAAAPSRRELWIAKAGDEDGGQLLLRHVELVAPQLGEIAEDVAAVRRGAEAAHQIGEPRPGRDAAAALEPASSDVTLSRTSPSSLLISLTPEAAIAGEEQETLGFELGTKQPDFIGNASCGLLGPADASIGGQQHTKAHRNESAVFYLFIYSPQKNYLFIYLLLLSTNKVKMCAPVSISTRILAFQLLKNA